LRQLKHNNIYFITLFIFGCIVAQPIPSNDPAYQFLQQEFQQTQNLELYVKPFPFNVDQFNGLRFYPGNQHGIIRIAPNIKITRNIPDVRLGIWFSGQWDKFSFLAEPLVVNEIYADQVLGRAYSRGGVAGRFENAFIRYQIKNNIIQLGRSPVWWGQSFASSIIQSATGQPYDHLTLKMNISNFQFELLAGQLTSEMTENDERVKRFISGHQLKWLPNHNRWFLAVGEQIIYTGIKRSFEFHYLNPIIPYWFAEIEEEEERNPAGTENENTILFFHGRYLLKENVGLYGELVIDDFQIDFNNRDSIPDAIGWKVGIDGVLGKEILFLFELTTIGTWTYTHWGEFTSWHNSSIPIGYKYGPDCRSWLVSFDYWLSNDWLLSVENTFLEKGNVNIFTQLPPEVERKVDFPSPPVVNHHYLNVSLNWHTNRGLISCGWNGNFQQPDNDTIYLKIQLINDFSFDF
tara:strand:- start:2388 stop:3773 length:1386 start_codon:yes stop_codon:yes gene_type:complete